MRIIAIFLSLVVYACQAQVPKQSTSIPLKLSQVPPNEPIITKVNADISLYYSTIEFVFSEPMQRIDGKSIPIETQPQFSCAWFWADARHLACNLNQFSNIKPATSYQIEIKNGLYSREGIPFKPYRYEFEVARPEIESIRVSKWKSINEPEIAIEFNIGVVPKSLRKRLYLVSAKGKKISLALQPVKEKDTSQTSEWFKNTQWILTPKQKLEEAQTYYLTQESGIRSPFGKLLSKKQTYNESGQTISTFGKFQYLGYECRGYRQTDLEKKGICTPGQRIRLNFSTPMLESELDNCKEKLESQGVQINRSSRDKTDITITVNLAAKKIRLDCLKNVKDIFGRTLDENVQISIETSDFPNVHWNKHEEEVLTNEDKLSVNHHSLNNEHLGLEIYKLDHKRQSIKSEVEFKNIKNKVVSFDALRERYHNNSQISGFVKAPDQRMDMVASFNIQKSNYNISLQRSSDRLLIFVSDIHDNSPVKSKPFKLEISDGGKNTTYQSRTNSQGIATIKIPKRQYFYPSGYLFTFGIKEKMSLNHNYILRPKINNESNNYANPSDEKRVLWGATDKPIYRPGEVVKYAAYLRKINGTATELVDLEKQSLLYVSGQGINCYRDTCDSFYMNKNPKLNKYGKLSGEFTLPRSTLDGTYTLQIKNNNGFDSIQSDVSFTVANFKAQSVKVEVKLSQKSIRTAEKLYAISKGSYYSGGPYKGAESSLNLTVSSKDLNGVFSEHGDYHFDANSCKTCQLNAHSIVQTGQLDKQGISENEVILPKSDIYYGQVNVQSQIKLDSGELLLSPAKKISYLPRPYFVGIKNNDWWLSGDKPIKIESRVIEVEGTIRSKIKVEYLILKSNYSWHDRHDQKEPSKPKKIDCDNEPKNGHSDDTCEFVPNVSGYYELITRITYPDGKAQQSKSGHYFYNDAKNEEKKLVINTDKSQLEIGQTAILKINHPYESASALITVHRNRLLKSWWQPLKKGLNEISIDVEKNYAPGFDVTVFVNYGDLSQLEKRSTTDFALVATQRFNVKNKLPRAALEISTDKSIYPPSEEISVKLNNSENNEMDITLLMIDQSILDQVESKSYLSIDGGLLDTSSINWDNPGFYELALKLYSGRDKEKWDKVMPAEKMAKIAVTGSRLRSLSEAPSNPRAQTLRDLLPLVRADRVRSDSENNNRAVSFREVRIGNTRVKLSNLRSLFKESAYWNSNITIPAGQSKSIEIKLPDNLTEWKIVAIASNKEGVITISDRNIKTQKEVEVRSDIPTQLIVGDQFFHKPYAVPRNADLKSLKLSTAAEDIESKIVIVEQVKSFDAIKAFDRYSMSVPIHTDLIGTTQILTVTDATGKNKKQYQDAMLQRVPVLSSDMTRTQTQYSILPDNKQIHFDKPKFNSKDNASVQFKLSGSLISQLSATNEYMKSYPHQCWEQKSSRALVAALQLKSGEYGKNDKEILKNNIQDAISSFGDFQASNGGMAFFGKSNNSVSVYLSAYSYLVAQRLSKNGYPLSTYNIDKLEVYLKKLITKGITENRYSRNLEQLKNAQKILILNALSQDPKNLPFVEKQLAPILEEKDQHGDFTQGQLIDLTARIPKFIKHSKSFSLALLENTRVTNKKRLLVKNTKMPWYYYDFDAKKYCSVISGLTQQSFDQKTVYQLINGALEKRRSKKGDFGNTLSNAYCAMAISDYVEEYEEKFNDEKSSSSSYQLSIQNQSTSIDLNKTVDSTDIDLSGDLSIEIKGKQSTTAYLESKLSYRVDGSKLPPIANGFSLQRTYQVYRDNKWIELNNKNVHQGDYIKIRLEINNPLFRRYVALADRLAGGFFSLDKNLATSAPPQLFKSLRQDFYFNEKQLGTKDARFYADYLPPGTHVIEYLVKAAHQGEFAALAARVEEMYDDDVFGSTEAVRVIIH